MADLVEKTIKVMLTLTNLKQLYVRFPSFPIEVGFSLFLLLVASLVLR